MKTIPTPASSTLAKKTRNVVTHPVCTHLDHYDRKQVDAERQQAVTDFAQNILHGDKEHRQWLLDAATAFNAGKNMPGPVGSGTREMFIRQGAEEMRERCCNELERLMREWLFSDKKEARIDEMIAKVRALPIEGEDNP